MTKRVLVVEDQEDLRGILRDVLTSSRYAKAGSFDHFISDPKQSRHDEVERPRRLDIDDQLEFERLHYRQVSWPSALNNLPGVLTHS